MSEDKLELEPEMSADFSNCCNGKVGSNMLREAKNDPEIQKMILPNPPKGVEVLSTGGLKRAGGSGNCCNGKVGASTSSMM